MLAGKEKTDVDKRKRDRKTHLDKKAQSKIGIKYPTSDSRDFSLL